MELIFKRKSLPIQYTESSEADDKASKPISHIFLRAKYQDTFATYFENIKTSVCDG